MDIAPFSKLASSVRALAVARWKPLLLAIAAAAVIDAIVWVTLPRVLDVVVPDSPELPSMVMVHGVILFAWALVVAALALPMTTATAALADDDPAPLAWLPRALREFPAQWVRIAIPMAPIALLIMWLVHSIFSFFKEAMSSLSTLDGSSTKLTDPTEMLAFKAMEFVSKQPVQITMFVLACGLWMLWASTRATGLDDRLRPASPLNLYGRPVEVVLTLVAVTSLVLGPLLNKVVSSLGSGFRDFGAEAAAGAASEAASTGVVFVLGALLATFISAAALPWVALFGDEHDAPERTNASAPTPAAGEQPQPGLQPAAEHAATAAAASHAAPPSPLAAPAAQQVVDAQYVAQPGAPVGAWWMLPAGATVLLETAASGEVAPQPTVADSSQAWCQVQPGAAPTSASFTAPAAGWYLLGAWLATDTPQHVHVRLTLPADAQPAPAAA